MLALRVVLAVEGAVPAEGDRPQAEGRAVLFALPAHDLRAEADGEFHHLDARQPRRQEVARLMHRHQDAQQQNRNQYIQNCHMAPFRLSGPHMGQQFPDRAPRLRVRVENILQGFCGQLAQAIKRALHQPRNAAKGDLLP